MNINSLDSPEKQSEGPQSEKEHYEAHPEEALVLRRKTAGAHIKPREELGRLEIKNSI